PRGPVVAFSGRLLYRPNALAVQRLLHDVWPRVVRAAPDARLLVGGADAPAWLRARDGTEGVEVVGPVADMSGFTRRARVAVGQVAMGTGTPNKLFEAFEAGAAVVASPEVLARASGGADAPPARSARTDAELADAVVELLRDAGAASDLGARGRAWVEA